MARILIFGLALLLDCKTAERKIDRRAVRQARSGSAMAPMVESEPAQPTTQIYLVGEFSAAEAQEVISAWAEEQEGLGFVAKVYQPPSIKWRKVDSPDSAHHAAPEVPPQESKTLGDELYDNADHDIPENAFVSSSSLQGGKAVENSDPGPIYDDTVGKLPTDEDGYLAPRGGDGYTITDEPMYETIGPTTADGVRFQELDGLPEVRVQRLDKQWAKELQKQPLKYLDENSRAAQKTIFMMKRTKSLEKALKDNNILYDKIPTGPVTYLRITRKLR